MDGFKLFSTIPKVIRTIYQEEFYAYLRQEKKNIKFWIWFELFKQEEYPGYPCKRINNTSTKAKIWKTSDNIVIESIHPPEAKIEKNINGTIVTASPFIVVLHIKTHGFKIIMQRFKTKKRVRKYKRYHTRPNFPPTWL